MATAPKNSPSEEARSLVECPVCVSTFRNPKSLRCGHSVCFECCQQLRTALHVVCPVCRTRTPVPAEGLPTNFALQDLVEHHVTQHQAEKKHICSACERRHLIDESWICSLCNSALICANCAIKDHRGHDLQMVSDIISRRREELAGWRQRMEVSVREVDARRRQIDANLVRIEQRAIQLNATLRTKLEPRFADAIQELNAERDQLFKAIHDVDVSDIIGATSNDATPAAHVASRFENQLNEVPLKLDALKTKQEQILADQRLALEVVQNCNEVLRQMVSSAPKPAEGQQQQAQSGAGASSATATDITAGRGIVGWGLAARRGRIFPHPLNERRSFIAPTSTESQPSRFRPSLEYESDVRRIDFMFGLAPSSGEEEENGDGEQVMPALNASNRVSDRSMNHDDEQAAMEVEPAAVVIEESSPRSVQSADVLVTRRPTAMIMSRLGVRGRRESPQAVATSASRVLPAPGVDVHMEITSDEEAEARAIRGFGRGTGSRRRSGGNSLPLRLGKGRGRTLPEPNTPLTNANRSREELSPSATARGDSMDSPVILRVRQRDGQERRISGRQQNGGEDGAGPSGSDAAAASGDVTRVRYAFDDSSDDDDVAEGILFHTFLHSGERSNDKTKH